MYTRHKMTDFAGGSTTLVAMGLAVAMALVAGCGNPSVPSEDAANIVRAYTVEVNALSDATAKHGQSEDRIASKKLILDHIVRVGELASRFEALGRKDQERSWHHLKPELDLAVQVIRMNKVECIMDPSMDSELKTALMDMKLIEATR